jgi:predicted nucleotidyltransferase
VNRKLRTVELTTADRAFEPVRPETHRMASMTRIHRLDGPGREAVLDKLAQALTRREDVVFAYVHGSFQQEEGFHDVDLAVWMNPAASERLDLELGAELSEVVGFPVDVRVVNRASVAFLFHVVRGRLLLVRDERLLADLIERTARSYHDAAPLARRAVREAFTA